MLSVTVASVPVAAVTVAVLKVESSDSSKGTSGYSVK
jgi:hypothetical protein